MLPILDQCQIARSSKQKVPSNWTAMMPTLFATSVVTSVDSREMSLCWRWLIETVNKKWPGDLHAWYDDWEIHRPYRDLCHLFRSATVFVANLITYTFFRTRWWLARYNKLIPNNVKKSLHVYFLLFNYTNNY